jgi:hypothetical protein
LNQRGQYGAPSASSVGHYGVPRVGLIHTPQDTEDEMDQLHNEIMQFGGEAQSKAEAERNRLKEDPGYKERLAKVKAAWDYTKSLPAKTYDQLQALVFEQGLGFKPVDLTEPWIRDFFRNSKKPEVVLELERWTAKSNAAAQARQRENELAAYFNQISKNAPLLVWDANVWDPFRQEWLSWRSDHQRPAQLWPGSGAWDRIQDYRAKYIEIRNKAPFKAVGPSPISPEARRDPSLLGGLADFGSGLKWVVLGVLGVGGVLAVSSVASNLKKRRQS